MEISGIKVIPTPGHTPGHVSLIYKNVLFTGDLVRNSKGKIEPMKSSMNWDSSLAMESILKIEEYDFEWICTTHGEPIRREDASGLLTSKKK